MFSEFIIKCCLYYQCPTHGLVLVFKHKMWNGKDYIFILDVHWDIIMCYGLFACQTSCILVFISFKYTKKHYKCRCFNDWLIYKEHTAIICQMWGIISPGHRVPSYSFCSVQGESLDPSNHSTPEKKTFLWVCEGQDKSALERETEWATVFRSFWSVFLADSPARLLGVLQRKNKNIWSVRLTARAHLLFVITYAPGPVYILLSVSTGVFIRKFVPYAPSRFRFREQ